MLKDLKTVQRVKALTDDEYAGKEGVFHYTDDSVAMDGGEIGCTVTFGDGKPTYFAPSELEPI